MTLTLEAHFGGRVALRALSHVSRRRARTSAACCCVAGVLGAAGRDGRDPHRPRGLRARASARRSCATSVPLGRVLRDGGVDYRSRPTQFLSVTPNSEMMGVFWMREPRTLYGRRTEMSVDGRKIGDIVEMLPAVSDAPSASTGSAGASSSTRPTPAASCTSASTSATWRRPSTRSGARRASASTTATPAFGWPRVHGVVRLPPPAALRGGVRGVDPHRRDRGEDDHATPAC